MSSRLIIQNDQMGPSDAQTKRSPLFRTARTTGLAYLSLRVTLSGSMSGNNALRFTVESVPNPREESTNWIHIPIPEVEDMIVDQDQANATFLRNVPFDSTPGVVRILIERLGAGNNVFLTTAHVTP